MRNGLTVKSYDLIVNNSLFGIWTRICYLTVKSDNIAVDKVFLAHANIKVSLRNSFSGQLV